MAAITKQQEYLLNRMPKVHDIKNEIVNDPAAVVKAKKVINAYEAGQRLRRENRRMRLTKLINAAREAVYFKPAEEALKIIKALEEEMEK